MAGTGGQWGRGGTGGGATIRAPLPQMEGRKPIRSACMLSILGLLAREELAKTVQKGNVRAARLGQGRWHLATSDRALLPWGALSGALR
jgi:hypothetical protein